MGEYETVDALLRILDAETYPLHGTLEAAADLLEETGRYWEACILRECMSYIIRPMTCGHLHVRAIGCGFNLGQLGKCSNRAVEADE